MIPDKKYFQNNNYCSRLYGLNYCFENNKQIIKNLFVAVYST